jgi:Mg/Co/Ni transporter MgtE
MEAVSPGSMAVAKKTAKETMSNVMTAITSRFATMRAISEFTRDLRQLCMMMAIMPIFIKSPRK